MDKCELCAVRNRVRESKEPACCKWYLEHVVILEEPVDNCPDFEPCNSAAPEEL